MCLDALAHRLHDLEVDADEIIAAHAGLARHTGRDDADIGTGNRLIAVGAGELGVKAFHRAGLRQVERLALRQALGNVEDHDVAQFAERGEMRQRAPDHATTDQCDFLARHGNPSPPHIRGMLQGGCEIGISLVPLSPARGKGQRNPTLGGAAAKDTSGFNRRDAPPRCRLHFLEARYGALAFKGVLVFGEKIFGRCLGQRHKAGACVIEGVDHQDEALGLVALVRLELWHARDEDGAIGLGDGKIIGRPQGPRHRVQRR